MRILSWLGVKKYTYVTGLLCSLIITMFERNYAALATIILHSTKYITDDVCTVYTICYSSASESESESDLNIT